MTLRRKMLISIGLTISFLIAALYVLARVIGLRSSAALERDLTQQKLARIVSVIEDDVTAIDILASDWAAWDDTYEFIAGRNQDYIDSNLVDETLTGARLNFVLFINTDGELVYSKGYDLLNKEPIPIPESLLQHVTSQEAMLPHHPDTDSVVKGLLALPEGPLLLTSRPILTSEGKGPVRGALIMARYLDKAEIELLTETTLIPFTIQRFTQVLEDLRTALSAEKPTLVSPLDAGTIAGYALLHDVYGEPALVIEANMPRDIYQQGQRGLSYFVIALLVSGLVFGAVTLVLLERSVLARLARLDISVSHVSASGDLSRRVSIPGQDELSNLANTINTMLTKLEQAHVEHGQAEEAQRQYTHALAQLNQLGQQLTATLSLQQIAEQLSHIATEVVDIEGVSVWLLDVDRDELVCWAASNRLEVEMNRSPVDLHIRTDQGVVGWVMQHKERITISDAADDARFFPGIDETISFQTRSLLAVPLQVRDSVIGVLEMVNKLSGTFTRDDLNLAETLAASVAIAIDNARLIEELRQYTKELEVQNAELDAFAHTVAHDLKNPLSALTTFSTMLEVQHDEMETQQISQDLQVITRNAHRMTNIINELLLLASVRKMESVETRPMDMIPIVDEALERLSSIIAQHQGEISMPDEWPVAVGYGPWVQEVWANYISNALKYGGRPPRVELGVTKQEDGMVRFWVRDNGNGLTEKEQTGLFTEFTRLHQARARGYGLGLSIVRRIIEKLGGDAGVESKAGEGSTFYFTLPGDEPRHTKAATCAISRWG